MLGYREVTKYSITNVEDLNTMEINGLIMMAARECWVEDWAYSFVENLCYDSHITKYENGEVVIVYDVFTDHDIDKEQLCSARISALGEEGIRLTLTYSSNIVSTTFTVDELIDWGLI